MEKTYEYLQSVGSGKIGRVVMGKLKIGVDLLGGIEELVRRENIKTGIILSGVGALQKALFRNVKFMPADYKMEDKYRIFVEVKNPLEIISLTGWIATTDGGQTEIHAHFMASTVADDKIVCLGGHLIKGTITSIKDIITIGVIEGGKTRAAMDPQLNQIDIAFG